MNACVVDASVVAKWFLDDAHAPAALRLLDGRRRLHVPDFCLVEMDSILWKWIRRGEMSEAEARDIREALRKFPLRLHPAIPLLDPAFEIANRTGRSVYDCLYLALAALLKIPLVTADQRLYRSLAGGPFAQHLVWIADVPE